MNSDEKPTILVIDDTPDNMLLLHEVLKGEFRVKGAGNGRKGLEIATTLPYPDLILLDVMMPEMDGYQVCRLLKTDPRTQHIPVIFVTARSEMADEERGLALGAVDYITKPISPPIVRARVRTHLALKASADFLRDQNEFLEREVNRRAAEVLERTREIQAIQDVTIMALASLAETRDSETGAHIRRTQFYVKALAEELVDHPRFSADLTPLTIELMFKSAPLHDIGKVGIPDHILLKPGKLTPEEFEQMKAHTTLGRLAIEHAEEELGMQVDFLRLAKEIAYSHHEKWDGSGYPQGLHGEDIPLSARLMAIADVYDALISHRTYKQAMPHAHAVDLLTQGRGSHFDPDILDAFLRIQDQFVAIAARHGDPQAGLHSSNPIAP